MSYVQLTWAWNDFYTALLMQAWYREELEVDVDQDWSLARIMCEVEA